MNNIKNTSSYPQNSVSKKVVVKYRHRSFKSRLKNKIKKRFIGKTQISYIIISMLCSLIVAAFLIKFLSN